MPELPEVETTCSGIAPHIEGETLERVTVRVAHLRYPVSGAMLRQAKGHVLRAVERRGKYLMLIFDPGAVLIHLGMSGSLRIVKPVLSAGKHDHVDFVFKNGVCLRYTDPRKFGLVIWAPGDAFEHDLLKSLGPEPLTKAFNATYLMAKAQGRRINVKTLLMDSRVVVGVGNIYANEALFLAGVDPRSICMKLGEAEYHRIVKMVKRVLRRAIKSGGTTLKDFVNGEGKPGYFQQQLHVYGRGGQACHNCGGLIDKFVLGQRSTFCCSSCQKFSA